jgi:methionyl-tRNA formyltransferase
MRLLVLGNNWVAWHVIQWLRDRNADLVGLVVHPPGKRKFYDEILQAAALPSDRVFDGSTLTDPAVMKSIEDLNPDLGLSIFFGHILKPDFLELFGLGVINLHPSHLPFNRGQYPNVWSIVERSPAGVTLHYVDPGVDTGDIVAQIEVPVEPVDTGETLYRKLERASVQLFKDTWPLVEAGEHSRTPQKEGGSFHRTADVTSIDEIDLERTYKARDLIDILRARTFPPHGGAYFEVDGQRVEVRLTLNYRK